MEKWLWSFIWTTSDYRMLHYHESNKVGELQEELLGKMQANGAAYPRQEERWGMQGVYR